MKRYNPKIEIGLTSEQVSERIKEDLVHKDVTVPTKSIKQIISGNFFTLFNFLNFGLALAVLLVGSIKNVLFIGTVLTNMLISIVQEIRAKKIIDKLSLVSQSKTVVIRDGKNIEVDREHIVLDDLTVLRTGNQVIVDSIVKKGECFVNESFITGEDNPILKKENDIILSGSFIISGNIIAKVEHIKEDNYTSKISKDAKYIKKLNSKLMYSLNKIIKYISIVIVPIGILLFLKQLHIENNSIDLAVINTVAGLIGMIPEGLVLLTSTVLAVSVIRLSKYNVLVQELYCIEMLARVDVLCLDKTGTITEGKMEVKDIVLLDKNITNDDFRTLIDNICHTLEDISPTMNAIREKFETKKGKKLNYTKVLAFSSENKYSLIETEKEKYYLGAPEFILKEDISKEYSNDYRVILLAKEEDNIKTPIALILIQDKIRKEAKKTLEYFKEQGVEIKIISGDNPITVSQIAKRVGVENYDKYVDLSKIESNEELEEAYKNNTIFGRVKPNQKKELILISKKLGHTVGMTGDGVNDCLALKEADCSIAMASGSEAARNVSQLVLMTSNFETLPHVVTEGRRTINNIERSASLFLVKTIYTALLIAFFMFSIFHYPFKPIHLTLMNLITIGIPSFILALEPNKERVKGTFLSSVFIKAFPTALTVFTIIVAFLFVSRSISLSVEEESTICVILTTITMLLFQYRICKPFTPIRRVLLSSMCLIFILELLFFKDFFSLSKISDSSYIVIAIFIIISIILWNIYNYLINKFITKLR